MTEERPASSVETVSAANYSASPRRSAIHRGGEQRLAAFSRWLSLLLQVLWLRGLQFLRWWQRPFSERAQKRAELKPLARVQLPWTRVQAQVRSLHRLLGN